MTREEEIIEKACEFVDKRYQDVGILTTHEASVAACQDMAHWADEHPDLLNILADRRFMIDKACKWLEENLAKETSVLCSGIVHINFQNVLKEFRKAMEEL